MKVSESVGKGAAFECLETLRHFVCPFRALGSTAGIAAFGDESLRLGVVTQSCGSV